MSALVSRQEETHGSVAFIENITNQQYRMAAAAAAADAADAATIPDIGAIANMIAVIPTTTTTTKAAAAIAVAAASTKVTTSTAVDTNATIPTTTPAAAAAAAAASNQHSPTDAIAAAAASAAAVNMNATIPTINEFLEPKVAHKRMLFLPKLHPVVAVPLRSGLFLNTRRGVSCTKHTRQHDERWTYLWPILVVLARQFWEVPSSCWGSHRQTDHHQSYLRKFCIPRWNLLFR